MKKLKSLEDHNQKILKLRETVAKGVSTGFACPNCQSELFHKPNIFGMSIVAKEVYCLKCEFKGKQLL